MRLTRLFFVIILICTALSVDAQRRFQFSVMGGYEYFSRLSPGVRPSGGGIGAEFKYYLSDRFYSLANFHMGFYDQREMRMVEGSESQDKYLFDWTMREFNGGVGLGVDLLSTFRHIIFFQSTCGVSQVNIDEPFFDTYDPPTVELKDADLKPRMAASVTLGYAHRVTDIVSFGFDYTGWWISGVKFRHTGNVRLGFAF